MSAIGQFPKALPFRNNGLNLAGVHRTGAKWKAMVHGLMQMLKGTAIFANPQKHAVLGDMAGMQQVPAESGWHGGSWLTLYRTYSPALSPRLASIMKDMGIVIAASLIAALVIFLAFSLGVLAGATYYLWFCI